MDTTVRATCPQCQTVLRIPSQWLGQAIKCKKCGTVVRTKSRGDGVTETGHQLDSTPHNNGNGHAAGADPGAFDFNAGSDEGDGMFPVTEPFGASDEGDNGFDPTGGADASSQPAPAAPQPPAAPPGYPYPMPPGYPQPGAGGYGAPPGYPYAPPPSYPYGAPPGYPPGAPPGYGPPPGAPPGYGAPPGAPPGYGAPPGAYGAPPGYPYPPPPGYPPTAAPASGVYGAAPPGYPYPMPPGAAAPGTPPAPGMPPASGAYYGAGGGAYPPAPGAPAAPPAASAPSGPPAPKFSAPLAAPASGVMSRGNAPAKPASGVMSRGNAPAKPGVPATPAQQPAKQPAAAPRPAAQPVANTAFKTDVPAASAARARKGGDKSKMIWVAVCLVLTGGLVTAAILTAKSMNADYIAKKMQAVDPDKLVDLLGSNDATEREAAFKNLKAMGDKAETALKEGVKSTNPDVAKKSQELLIALKTATVPDKGHAKLGGAFPRRLLFIHISKYMFLNPLTAGQAGGEDRTKGAAIRMANEWNVPFDPKDTERNQLYFMSDTARPDNPKSNDVQTPMRNVVMGAYEQFFNTSRGQDRIVVYFGGHALELDGKTYLAPIEGDLDDPEPTLIPLSDFYDKLKACKATQRVVIWDVCRYNPQRGRQRPGSEPMTESLYKSLSTAPPGVEVVITCQPGENALEFFNVQIESGATANAAKYAGSAFLESMKYVAAKSGRTAAKQPVQSDPIPTVDWAKAVGDRVAVMATSPVVNLKQVLKLEGKGPANWVAFDPDAPMPKRFEFPLPPKGTNPAEVAAIVNEFNVPSIKLDLIDAGLGALPFRDEVMKDYKSDITIDMVMKDKDNYKFQAKTFEAIDKIRRMWTVTSGASGGPQMRDDFKAPVNDALKTEIKKEQDFWAIGVAELELINAELDSLAASRDSQQKRWQAHYDYARATIKARLAFMNEYNKLMGNVLTETLPALDAKLGQDTYKLTSLDKMKSGKDVIAIANEAKELYNKLITEHKGTPWAIQAKRDKAFSLGLAWQPLSSGAGTTP